MEKTMKIPIGEINEKSMQELKEHVLNNIKRYCRDYSPVDKKEVIQKLRIPPSFLAYKSLCLKCGHVEDLPAYAIAQIVQKHIIVFTCKCGHKTELKTV